MLHDAGVLTPAEAGQRLSDFRYSRDVFVAPPWPEIYTTDHERDQQFADAVRVHRRAIDWYTTLGFELIELPKVPVDERCDFVLRRLQMLPH